MSLMKAIIEREGTKKREYLIKFLIQTNSF